jgi:hypothetical protein
MKKILFVFIASVAMTFAACGGQTASEQNANDSDSIAVVDSLAGDSLVVDSLVLDSAVAE